MLTPAGQSSSSEGDEEVLSHRHPPRRKSKDRYSAQQSTHQSAAQSRERVKQNVNNHRSEAVDPPKSVSNNARILHQNSTSYPQKDHSSQNLNGTDPRKKQTQAQSTSTARQVVQPTKPEIQDVRCVFYIILLIKYKRLK